MSNEVEINPEALGAELSSIEIPLEPGEQVPQDGVPIAPADQAPAGELTLQQLEAAIPQWKLGADFMVNALSDAIAPNWGITAPEREQLSRSICLALEAWFPGQYIPVKFQVLLGVGGAIWGIVTVRRQANGGKLPPLRLPPPGGAKTGDPQPTPAQPAGTGGVTTST